MQDAQDGDRTAYASLLREILPILERLVRTRLGFLPVMDREDLVQEILLSLHAARATYDPRRPFMPWLKAIARNRMVDNARRNSRRLNNEVPTGELPTHVPDDHRSAASDDYGDPQALRLAVSHLPKAQRTAVELLKLREMSVEEASKLSGMSMGALRVSVHRAIQSLRASLHT
jgi:RNA polymerase sigma-70 factor (ECF subfamily)